MDELHHHFIWKGTFIVLLFSIFFSLNTAFAAENQSINNVVGFTYKADFPENQMEDGLGYYKLKMTPGQEQVITINLSNPGTKTTTILVGLNGAKTNQNGVIEYGESSIKNDRSLKVAFEDLVLGPKSVELAGGETKTVEFTVNMPENQVEGVIAGGIQLMKAETEEDKEESKGSTIINQYAYVIGMLLQENEEPLAPDLKLNKVFAEQYNHRNSIFVNFSNVIPTYLEDMTIEVKVNKKNKKEILYERKQSAMRMAPNSFISFPISMNGEKMEAGKYKAEIVIKSGDQRWDWSEEFDINSKEARKFNARDVSLVQEKSINWRLIMVIVFGVLLLIVIIFYGFRIFRKTKNKKQKQKKKKGLQRKRIEK